MKQRIYERKLADNILKNYKDAPIIKVLCGIRRSGKSFILKLIRQKLLSYGIDERCILYIDFEDFENRDIDSDKKLYERIKERFILAEKMRLYLLFDEIQEVSDWEKCVNSLYGSESIDCDIYITGSNAKLLSSELATYISGRYVTIPIYPLSYKEYLSFYNQDDSEKSFTEYITSGGFPGLAFMNKDEMTIKSYLEGIYSTVLLKDIIKRNNIRDTSLLEKIILYLCNNIGNIFSAKRIADFMKSTGRRISTETVYNHLKALEEAMFIYKISRYDIKGKKLLETMEKYYLADHGLRFALLGFKESAINGILENIVCIELLRRGYSVYIGKTGEYEIDFIAQKGDSTEYIQVCYLLGSEETKWREMRPLKLLQDNYPKYILSMDPLPKSNEDGIIRMNIREYLVSE